jgi:hypothetical protein
MPRPCLCRPSGAADMNAARGPTAYAVGYFLAPLRGLVPNFPLDTRNSCGRMCASNR